MERPRPSGRTPPSQFCTPQPEHDSSCRGGTPPFQCLHLRPIGTPPAKSDTSCQAVPHGPSRHTSFPRRDPTGQLPHPVPRRNPTGQVGTPPGHGGTPPGPKAAHSVPIATPPVQCGTPPGQAAPHRARARRRPSNADPTGQIKTPPARAAPHPAIATRRPGHAGWAQSRREADPLRRKRQPAARRAFQREDVPPWAWHAPRPAAPRSVGRPPELRGPSARLLMLERGR